VERQKSSMESMVMNKNNNFWEDRKILITGYEGFIGSWLTKFLLKFGAKIWGVDIKTRRKQTILSDKDLHKIKITKGSVENFSLISKIIEENKIEFIFHLAAKSLVGECLKKPIKAFSTNIKGTWNILEASRNSKTIKGVVIASSDKAYGIQSKLPYREELPLAGSHPYDVSKSCADLLTHTYFHTYHLPVCVVRCGNVFGGGDFNFSRIVPDAIRSIVKDRKLIIRSDGKFTRDYIYVEDVVGGYLTLARKMQRLRLFGEAFNFSNEKPISVFNLVKIIAELNGKGKANYKITNKAKHEIRHQCLSAKKARQILKWSPQYNLEEGLKETIKWYKDFLNKE
jgi:CDP-glucose 4,6-dehydratase